MQNLLAGGTMAGGIAMGTNKVQAWVITAVQDAATKAYVDPKARCPVLTIAGEGANDTVTVGTDNLTIQVVQILKVQLLIIQ